MAVRASFVVLAFLLLTNRHFTLDDRARIDAAAGDVWSYLEIARAAPGLPREEIRHHHAQRFALPFLAGVLTPAGASPEVAMRALVWAMLAAAVLLTERLLTAAGFAVGLRLSLLTLLFWNPYVARVGLAFPFMGNDLGFVLGSILAFGGLIRGSAAGMLAGSALAILCRQTALVFLFPMGLFFLLGGRFGADRRLRLAALGSAAVVISGYVITGLVAAPFSAPSENLSTVTALFTWLAREFDAGELAGFLLRGLAAFAVPVAAFYFLLPHLPRFFPSRRAAFTGFLLLLAFAGIAAQPLLGGPFYGNLPRLSALGLWTLVFGALLLLPRASGDENPLSALSVGLLVAVLGLHSLHHQLSWPGEWLLRGNPGLFLALQLSLCACLAVAVYGRRIFAKNR